MILDAVRPVGMRRPQLVGVDRGCRYTSVTPGAEVEQCLLDRAPRADARVHEVVGEHDAFLVGESPVRKADQSLAARAGHAQRQPEVDGELEVDVEELGPQLHRPHVRVDVRHVEAPVDRPLELGPALLAHLVEVGVVPHVLDRAREAAVAVEQAGGVGDRAPAVRVPLRVEREVHADVLAAVHRGRVARPRARHHQRRAGRHAVAQRFVDRDVRRTRRPEVVAVDDQQLRVGRVPEPFREARRSRRLREVLREQLAGLGHRLRVGERHVEDRVVDPGGDERLDGAARRRRLRRP